VQASYVCKTWSTWIAQCQHIGITTIQQARDLNQKLHFLKNVSMKLRTALWQSNTFSFHHDTLRSLGVELTHHSTKPIRFHLKLPCAEAVCIYAPQCRIAVRFDGMYDLKQLYLSFGTSAGISCYAQCIRFDSWIDEYQGALVGCPFLKQLVLQHSFVPMCHEHVSSVTLDDLSAVNLLRAYLPALSHIRITCTVAEFFADSRMGVHMLKWTSLFPNLVLFEHLPNDTTCEAMLTTMKAIVPDMHIFC
jgi:hypothetical protein